MNGISRIEIKDFDFSFRKPSNAQGILIETHETTFFGSILRITKWDMNQNNIVT